MVVAIVLILGGLDVGFTPVPDISDSESFHRGTPFLYDLGAGVAALLDR